jgi:small subunit ribosomal protein S20
MPNITAAKKSLRADARKRTFNDRKRRLMRENIKSFRKLVESKKLAEAQALLPTVYKMIDKASKGGILKDNTASRKKSVLARFLARSSA